MITREWDVRGPWGLISILVMTWIRYADIRVTSNGMNCTDTQPKKIILLSHFHVQGDKQCNSTRIFLSKKTMFSSFPFSRVLGSNVHCCHAEI